MKLEIDNKKVFIDEIEYEPKRDKPSDICANCGNESFKVFDSRNINGFRIRRKRCLLCGHSWKTIEVIY